MVTMNIKKLVFAFWLLRIISFTSCQFGKESTHSTENTEETKNIFILIEGNVVPNTLINGTHAARINLHLTFQGTSYIIDLLLNTYLVPSTYVEKIVTENETIYRHFNQSMDMCYYVGEVRNNTNWKAAFRTCPALQGFFVANDSTFYVAPLHSQSHDVVQAYEIKKIENDSLTEWICGFSDWKEKFIKATSSRVKREIISESMEGQKVIELYVANDARRLRYFGGDMDMLSISTKEIVNSASLVYQPLGFFVVLVGVEHWTTDQIFVSTTAGVTLTNWKNYRANYIVDQHYNDVGYLLSKQSFEGGILGLSKPWSICSSRDAAAISAVVKNDFAVSGATLAHEIGHMLGLSHDSTYCVCDSSDVSCIMSERASESRPSLYFSNCSIAELKTSVERGFDICLKDLPLNQSSHYQVCGNGIMEDGEECDCGRRSSNECNSECCDTNTCKLIGQAKCASGKCCDVNTCRLKQAGFRCRPTIGPCDITEVCNGTSAFCPENVYKHDGTTCSADGVGAYCWSGMCRSQRFQCNLLFGVHVNESNPLCYETFNVKGNVDGFCSQENGTFSACQLKDVMCGALQCNTKNDSLIHFTNFIMQSNKTASSYRCRSVLMDYGSRVENPGMVPNGAACGDGMMCVSQKCLSVDLVLDENPCPPCNDTVCTNEGVCVCDPDTPCKLSETTNSWTTEVTTRSSQVTMNSSKQQPACPAVLTLFVLLPFLLV